MPRLLRITKGNQIYHVLNRINLRYKIFITNDDYLLFEQTLFQAIKKFEIKLIAYAIMPNHFHLMLLPTFDNQLSTFMHWLSSTFTQRWHQTHLTTGTGHLFQGRYKSIIVDNDSYLLQLLMYIERNALKANLVKRAEDWRWSSLWIKLNGTTSQKQLLFNSPLPLPENYVEQVNQIPINTLPIEITEATKERKRGRPRIK